MDVTGYETLVVERRGPVGWLIFDRPEVANAMDARMLAELESEDLLEDPLEIMVPWEEKHGNKPNDSES